MRLPLSLICHVHRASDSSPPTNPFSKEVTDESGTNRLALIYVSVGQGPRPNIERFDFHSLVWRTKSGTDWIDRIVITKADFEAGAVHGRCIRELESFNPDTGIAIIKVAEHGVTNGTA